MNKLWILSCLFLVSCVMPGDLRRLEDSAAEKETRIDGAIASLRTDAIDEDQAREIIGAAIDTYNREVEDVVEEATERTEAAIEAVKGGALSLGELAGGGAGVAGIAAVLLNLYRNSTRKKELERAIKG